MLDLAIVGGTVVTMDPARRILRDGAIGVRDGSIVAVAPRADDLPPARSTIDAAGTIVLPGFVDGHGHAGHCLTRGLADGAPGDGWTRTVETIYFHAADERFWAAESALAALERLRFGVTTSLSMTGSSPRVDDARYAVAASSGYRRLGLRHVVAAGPPNGPWPRQSTDWSTPERPVAIASDLDRALAVTAEIAQAFAASGDDRVRFFVGPSSISPTLDPDDPLTRKQIRGVKEIVERFGTGLHAHAFAGQVRTAHAIDPELLGPHASLAHCAGIDLAEMDILAAAGTSASHGPLTHAYAAQRFGVIEALAAGVNVAISTDGTAPDRSFDLLGQARIARQLQRVHFQDADLLPAGRVLAMITIDAARALGMDGTIGSIEVGKKADLVLVAARQADLVPEMLAVQRLIGHASGADVDTVIVDGQVLMERRQVTGIDEDAILREAEAAFAETWERTGFADPEVLPEGFWTALRYGDSGG